MNKRNELKKRNAVLFLKKNVFCGKYPVRNIIATTVAVSAIAGVVGITGAIKSGVSNMNTATSTDSSYVVEADVETEINTEVINVSSISQLDSNSVDMILADMDSEYKMDVEKRQTELVTYAPGDFDKKFVGTVDNAYIYADADEDSAEVGIVNKGTVGDILSSKDGWVNVTSGEVTGYIKAENIMSGDEAAEFAANYYTLVGTVTEDGVNVRKEASKTSDYVDIADEGDTYTVADYDTVDSDWVNVEVDEYTDGYIYKDFVDIEGSYPEAVAVENSDVAKLPDGTGSIAEANNKGTGTISAKEKATTEATTEEAKESSSKTTETAKKTEATTEAAKKTTEATTEAAKKTTEATTEAEETEEDEDSTMARGQKSISADDLNLMASVVACEAGGESYEGQVAVANVILNRYLSGSYGSSVDGVVYAASQFTVVSSSKFSSYVSGGAPSTAMSAVKAACAGSNNVGSYTQFRPVSSVDLDSLGSYTIIGNHVFF